MMMKTIAALVAVAALATGCNFAVSADESAAQDVPVSGDVVGDAGGDAAGTRPSDDTLREQAQALLGLAEDELADDVRVARRGDEQMALTEDYQVGRYTVELDDDGTGTFRVTSVTVELGDSPETFDA